MRFSSNFSGMSNDVDFLTVFKYEFDINDLYSLCLLDEELLSELSEFGDYKLTTDEIIELANDPLKDQYVLMRVLTCVCRRALSIHTDGFSYHGNYVIDVRFYSEVTNTDHAFYIPQDSKHQNETITEELLDYMNADMQFVVDFVATDNKQ